MCSLWGPTRFHSWTFVAFDVQYVNDIYDVSKELEFILFADDTYVFHGLKSD